MFKATKFNICVIGMIVGTALISMLPFMGLTCRWCTAGGQPAHVRVIAKQHRDTMKHKINLTEYLANEPAYFSYITSVLENDMEP